MSAENDATTLRVDISPSPTNGSSPSLLSQPITPIESTSTYAMVKNNNDDSKIKIIFSFRLFRVLVYRILLISIIMMKMKKTKMKMMMMMKKKKKK